MTSNFLPHAWRSAMLGDVTREVVDRVGSSGAVPRIYGVERETGLTPTPKYVAKDTSRYKKIEPGMFAYNPMRLNIGSLGFCSPTHQPGAVSPDYVVFQCDPLLLDPLYMHYVTKSPQWDEWARGAGVGSVRVRIYYRELARMQLRVPPVDEQRAIAAVLSALDNKIEQNRRTSRALEALARATFKAWFVDFEPVKAKAAGQSSFPGMPPAAFAALPDRFTDSALGPVPQGWAVVDIYQLANVVYGAPFASKLFNDHEEGKPLIRIRDLQTHAPSIFTTEQHLKGTLIHSGEIVVGMDGEFRLHYWTGPDAWLNQRLCSFKPLPQIPTMYLGEALRAPLDYVERSEAATTVIHLGKYDIDRFELLRPNEASLTAFDCITSPMLNLIVQSAAEAAKLANLRDYLLPRLLSGRVRVSNIGPFTRESL